MILWLRYGSPPPSDRILRSTGPIETPSLRRLTASWMPHGFTSRGLSRRYSVPLTLFGLRYRFLPSNRSRHQNDRITAPVPAGVGARRSRSTHAARTGGNESPDIERRRIYRRYTSSNRHQSSLAVEERAVEVGRGRDPAPRPGSRRRPSRRAARALPTAGTPHRGCDTTSVRGVA